MIVTVTYNGPLKLKTGRREEKVEVVNDCNIEDLLYTIDAKYKIDLFEKGTKNIKPLMWIFVNGRIIAHLQDSQTMLHDGDQVMITPPVGGG